MNTFYIFLFILLLGVIFFYFSNFYIIKKIKLYLLEVKSEFFKISWANKKDVIRTTLIVFLVIIVLSFLIWVVDIFFIKIIEKVFFKVGVY